MEYSIALLIGAHAAFILMLGALAIYARRVASVRSSVSSDTFRALIFFGFTSFFMGVIILVATYTDTITAQRYPILFFMMSLINALTQISTQRKSIQYFVYTITVGLIVSQIIVTTLFPTEASPVLIAFLTVVLSLVILGSVWTFSSSPSPFGAGLLILESSFLLFWFLTISGIMYSNNQLYPFVFIPVAMAIALLGSLLRPPRIMATLFIGALSVIMIVGFGLASFLAGDYLITAIVIIVNIPVFATILSIDFFAEQMSSTRATVPTYITLTLVIISLLLILLSIELSVGLAASRTAPLLAWFEFILSGIGASSFVMAGYATLSQKYLRQLRRILLGILGAVIVISNEYFANGRWTVNDVGMIFVFELIVGYFAYGRTAMKLRRIGASKAARNFTALMSTTILIGFVLFTDYIFPPLVTMVLLIFIAMTVVMSSPRRILYTRSRSNR